MKKINTLQLITGLGMGGAEKVVLDLSKFICKDRYNNHVVSLSSRNELYNEFVESGINPIVLNKSKSIYGFLSIIFILNKFVRDNNIQLIHAHMVHALIVATVLKIFKPSLKIVYTSHNINIGSILREAFVWALKPFRNIDIVFSNHLNGFFYKSNCVIIPNGVEIDKYNLDYKKNKRFTFISVGRLETVKNHKLLIEIARDLRSDFDFEINIVGHGYLFTELDKLIESYELKDCVKLLGLRNDISTLLNKSHCFVMPSLWEGFPISILEAGASGLPVISTSVGSIPSLLNESNSYLCELDEFEEKMIDVLTNYNFAKEKSAILFEDIVKNHSIESVLNRHEEIYKTLVLG